MFIKIAPITTAGVVGPDEAYHMIMPYNSQPQRAVSLRGNAPVGADLAHSLELQLPMLCNNWQFETVVAMTSLYVAFEPGGPEWNTNASFGNFYTNVSQIFVRGGAAPVLFQAILTERNNPIA